MLLGLASACSPIAARADSADYLPENRGWNGLSELLAVASETGTELRSQARVELSAIRPSDGVLVVYPEQRLPRADLTAFMLEGGRLAVADDFGAGAVFVEAFGIRRHAPATRPAERRLRGNPNLLIAKPGARHPLNAGVLALVTNHPQVLEHPELEAVFSLDEQGGALVLSGAVGKGRLLALADPSALINNMLEFRGNRSFARNLVRYLAPHGRLWLVTPRTELVGRYGQVAGDPLSGLRAGLARLSQVRLPDAAVRLSTAVIAAFLLLGLVTALPRRRSYARAMALPRAETPGGFAGRVAFFARGERNLLTPLCTYKFALEAELRARLCLPAQAPLSEVKQAMLTAGVPAPLAHEAQELLLELRRLALARESPPEPPVIGRRKFHAMLALGERILQSLAGAASAGGARER